MVQKFKRLSLDRQMFYSFSCASALLLTVTLVLVLYFDMDRQKRSIEATISSTAAYVSSVDEVVDMLERGYPVGAVKNRLDLLASSYTDLNSISVYDRDGVRFYHTNRQETGETYVAGEEEPILAGAEPYVTTGYSTLGRQQKAFHAIRNSQGEIIGFVTVAIFSSGILQQNLSLLPVFGCILAAALLIALLLSRGIVQLLKRSLHGYHPDELLDIYLKQDGVLNAVEEGLIATDPEGGVVFANDKAKQLFDGTAAGLRGQSMDRVWPDNDCARAARTGEAIHNRSVVIGGRQVLATTLPIQGEGSLRGVLSIFYDKTELRALSDELSGTREMLDTLRYFNHEFMNKLHIILGYIQTNQLEEATQFIVNSSLVSSRSIRETASCIRVPRLCALIIGKMMHAAELGISLTVARDSCCREEDLLLSAEDCGTILGNLLENAIEELSRCQREIREIKLSIYCRPDCNLMVCEDTGGGVPEELLDRVWEKGFSTKGECRGCGLPLVQSLTQEHGGSIQIDTEPEEGTVFTLTFTKEREEH